MKTIETGRMQKTARTLAKLVLTSALAMLTLVAVKVKAQFAVARPLNVPVFCGTGLQAISTVGSNNWTVAGPFGGLSGALITTNYAQLVAGQGAALNIRFNLHGLPTNQLFEFGLTVDGTNVDMVNLLRVFTGQTMDAGPGNTGGATNGFSYTTNFTAEMLRGGIGLVFMRYTNAAAFSNLVITCNQSW